MIVVEVYKLTDVIICHYVQVITTHHIAQGIKRSVQFVVPGYYEQFNSWMTMADEQ